MNTFTLFTIILLDFELKLCLLVYPLERPLHEPLEVIIEHMLDDFIDESIGIIQVLLDTAIRCAVLCWKMVVKAYLLWRERLSAAEGSVPPPTELGTASPKIERTDNDRLPAPLDLETFEECHPPAHPDYDEFQEKFQETSEEMPSLASSHEVPDSPLLQAQPDLEAHKEDLAIDIPQEILTPEGEEPTDMSDHGHIEETPEQSHEDGPVEVPDGSTVEEERQALQGTSKAPQDTSGGSQETLEAPRESLKEPQEIHEASQEILDEPRETLETPQDTTKAPQEPRQTPQGRPRAPQDAERDPQRNAIPPRGLPGLGLQLPRYEGPETRLAEMLNNASPSLLPVDTFVRTPRSWLPDSPRTQQEEDEMLDWVDNWTLRRRSRFRPSQADQERR